MTDNYDDLQQSYGRCLRDKRFIERFYDIFLASHPDIAPLFANTDFQKQRLALRRGISIAITYAGGTRLVERSMGEMADVHSRSGRAPVPTAFYPFWVESLLTAVRETDPEMRPELEARWRKGLEATIDTFIAHH